MFHGGRRPSAPSCGVRSYRTTLTRHGADPCPQTPKNLIASRLSITMCNHRLAHPGLLHTAALWLGAPAKIVKISLAHPAPSLHPSTTKLQQNMSLAFLWFLVEKMSGRAVQRSECSAAPLLRGEARGSFAAIRALFTCRILLTGMPPHRDKTARNESYMGRPSPSDEDATKSCPPSLRIGYSRWPLHSTSRTIVLI
mgnify:FL=1